jgi:hypothetical protein
VSGAVFRCAECGYEGIPIEKAAAEDVRFCSQCWQYGYGHGLGVPLAFLTLEQRDDHCREGARAPESLRFLRALRERWQKRIDALAKEDWHALVACEKAVLVDCMTDLQDGLPEYHRRWWNPKAEQLACRNECEEQGMAHPSCKVHGGRKNLDLKAPE